MLKYVVYAYTKTRSGKLKLLAIPEYAGPDGKYALDAALKVEATGAYAGLKFERYIDGKRAGALDTMLPVVSFNLKATLTNYCDPDVPVVVFSGTKPEDETGLSGPLVNGPLEGA